jgi:plastocyanin
MSRLLMIAVMLVTVVTLAGPAPAAGKRLNVLIENLKYNPDTITIDVGDTIVWTNNDEREHTVTADDSSFNSGRLKKGKSYTRTFDKPGRYSYGSDPSPRTKGVVIVREAKK